MITLNTHHIIHPYKSLSSLFTLPYPKLCLFLLTVGGSWYAEVLNYYYKSLCYGTQGTQVILGVLFQLLFRGGNLCLTPLFLPTH